MRPRDPGVTELAAGAPHDVRLFLAMRNRAFDTRRRVWSQHQLCIFVTIKIVTAAALACGRVLLLNTARDGVFEAGGSICFVVALVAGAALRVAFLVRAEWDVVRFGATSICVLVVALVAGAALRVAFLPRAAWHTFRAISIRVCAVTGDAVVAPRVAVLTRAEWDAVGDS